MQDDPIECVLDDLLNLDDILGCMVARQNMISVMPDQSRFNPQVMELWDIIKKAMDDVFVESVNIHLQVLVRSSLDCRNMRFCSIFFLIQKTLLLR